MLTRKPCRKCVGGGAHDDLDAGFVHRVEYTIDVTEVEYAFLRFEGSPCRLRDAHDGDAGRLHHADIFVQSVAWGVFLVIGGAEEDGLLCRFGRLTERAESV